MTFGDTEGAVPQVTSGPLAAIYPGHLRTARRHHPTQWATGRGGNGGVTAEQDSAASIGHSLGRLVDRRWSSLIFVASHIFQYGMWLATYFVSTGRESS